MAEGQTKAIIFDLGGVLINVDWTRVCDTLARRSRKGPEDIMGAVSGSSVSSRFMRGLTDPHQFHREFSSLIEASIPFGEVLDIWNSPFAPNEGIVPLVRALGKRHRLVLGSNTDPLHFSYAVQRFKVLQLRAILPLLRDGPFEAGSGVLPGDTRGTGASARSLVFIDDRPANVDSARGVGIPSVQFQTNEELGAELTLLGAI